MKTLNVFYETTVCGCGFMDNNSHLVIDWLMFLVCWATYGEQLITWKLFIYLY